MMTSFVEAESERRSQDRSRLLLPAELVTSEGKESITIMELRRKGCRAVVSTAQVKGHVTLLIPVPKRETIEVRARVSWSKELAPKKWHVTFDDFDFARSSHKQTLVSYLNEIMVESEDLGVKALRGLGREELRRLSRLVKASRSLNPCQGYIQALEQVVDVTRRALGAERGLFLVNRGEDEFAVEVARGAAVKERGLRFSTTVARSVAESRAPLLSLDAQTDRTLGAVQSIKMMGTVSVMCVPLRTKSRGFGYLYVDNSMSKGIFRDSDLALATIIADLAAASLEKNWNHQLALQAERVSATKSLVSALSKDLLPALQTIQQAGLKVNADSQTQGQLEVLRNKSARCLKAIEDIQALGTTARRGRSQLDLMDIFEEIALDVGDHVEFPLPPPSGWPKLSADLEYLTDIVVGVIRAAQKDKQEQIKIFVTAADKSLKITVSNPALEISPRESNRLFQPFVDGGLSDVQRLVHEHKGLLRIHPDPNGGTVFTVDLPLKSA